MTSLCYVPINGAPFLDSVLKSIKDILRKIIAKLIPKVQIVTICRFIT